MSEYFPYWFDCAIEDLDCEVDGESNKEYCVADIHSLCDIGQKWCAEHLEGAKHRKALLVIEQMRKWMIESVGACYEVVITDECFEKTDDLPDAVTSQVRATEPIGRKDDCDYGFPFTCTCRLGPQYGCFQPLGALGPFYRK